MQKYRFGLLIGIAFVIGFVVCTLVHESMAERTHAKVVASDAKDHRATEEDQLNSNAIYTDQDIEGDAPQELHQLQLTNGCGWRQPAGANYWILEHGSPVDCPPEPPQFYGLGNIGEGK